MGRRKPLSLIERGRVLALHEGGISKIEIARRLHRSDHCIRNFLRDPDNYAIPKGQGRPKAVSTRDRRAILRVASHSSATARAIATEAGVHTHVRNVQRILKQSPTIKRKKMLKKPPLSIRHKQARLAFAEEHISWRREWEKVIFSDEKKFNLDGPDGYSFYYHDVRKEPRVRMSRQMGGGSVMIWAAIGFKQKSDVVFCDHKMNAEKYRDLLSEHLRAANRWAGRNYIFQQDNAPIHKARIVTAWLEEHNIRTLSWPARSPDLNIIENFWGELARRVYGSGRQYDSVQDLKTSIVNEWVNIPVNTVQNLYTSIPNRLLEVIKHNGGSTHY